MGDKYRILMVGYMTRNKGHMRVLRSLRNVDLDNVMITITGFGPEQVKLERYIRSNNIKNVVFEGVVSDQRILQLYRESHLLIAPGYEEPWGIRINEALGNNCYVLVSSGIGAKELIIDDINGSVFDTQSTTSRKNEWDKIISERRTPKPWDRAKIDPRFRSYELQRYLSDLHQQE